MKSIADYQTEFMLIKRSFCKFWNRGCDYSSHRKELGLRTARPIEKKLLLLILVVDINCDVTRNSDCLTAPEIHYAFRGRLLSLLVLRYSGVSPRPFLPQESSCISFANIVFGNNSILPVFTITMVVWSGGLLTPAGLARV